MSEGADVAAGRLSAEQLAANFTDAHPPLTRDEARVEADRCYFCYDAPCVQACPTGIDIPSFIRKIATGNLKGSATAILSANILGGSCARVCPTEILCEQACVRTTQENRPIRIGALQRYATDWLFAQRIQPFARGTPTGRRVAVVGAGPAGLACAHRLALAGHAVTIFEARPKPGGLNEYGVAAYKLVDGFAQREVEFVLGVGGIRIEYGKALGRDITLDALRRGYDAVFLGLGQSAVNALGLEGEATLGGVRNAVDFIAELRQATDLSAVAVGRRVVVIGGGNTAIDAASQSRRLGAEDVTIAYRRGPRDMPATVKEQAWAQTSGVRIRHWLAPVRLEVHAGHVAAVVFARTRMGEDGKLVFSDERVTIAADMVLKAVGQRFFAAPLEGIAPAVANGRIVVDADCRTSVPGVFAGGDCIAGPDLTVNAVQDGKIAAEAIDRMLRT
jgi:dihydropyrimidine dehydrogenase (NAD+) subunit PreT